MLMTKNKETDEKCEKNNVFNLPEAINWFQKDAILLLQCHGGVERINLQSAMKAFSHHKPTGFVVSTPSLGQADLCWYLCWLWTVLSTKHRAPQDQQCVHDGRLKNSHATEVFCSSSAKPISELPYVHKYPQMTLDQHCCGWSG